MIIERIKQTEPGTWLVYEEGQEPVSGMAVWEYSFGRMCEKHGAGPCEHLGMVEAMRPFKRSTKLSNSY